MADFLPPLVAELRADISDFKAKMGEARAESASMAESGSSNFERFASVGKAAFLGLGAVAVTAAVVGVEAADKWEGAHARLTTAIKNEGSTWSAWGGVVDSAESKSEKLAFTNADVENSLARLVPAAKTSAQATKDLSLAEDIARGRHIDLQAATDMLVKVEGQHYTSLSKTLGVSKQVIDSFHSSGDALAYLTAHFKGDSQAYVETFGGKLQVVETEATDLAKNIGVALIPAIETMVGGLADSTSWLIQNKDAAIPLAVVIGGPLVAAMGAYAAKQVLVVGRGLVQFWGEAADGAMLLAQGLDVATVATMGLGGATAVAVPAIGAFAVGYYGATWALKSIFGAGTDWNALLKDVTTSTNAAANANASNLTPSFDKLQDRVYKLYSATDMLPGPTTRAADAMEKLGFSVDRTHTANADLVVTLGAFRDVADKNLEQAARIAASTDKNSVAYKGEVEILKRVEDEHAKAAAAANAHQSAMQALGLNVDITTKDFDKARVVFGAVAVQTAANVGVTSAALTALAKQSTDFASSLDKSWASIIDSEMTHDFSKPIEQQAAVSEQAMQDYFVNSQTRAQAWGDDIQTLINDKVNPTIVQGWVKAGADSKPQLDAFVSMVDKMGTDWVNSTYASTGAQEQAIKDAFNANLITAATQGAEYNLMVAAQQDYLAGHGAEKMGELAHSADANFAQIAFWAWVQMQHAQGAVDSLHGKTVYIDGDASSLYDTINNVRNAVASVAGQVSTQLAADNAYFVGMLHGAHGLVTGAHGLVGLARGGSAAGMIVGPRQPVLIGEGLSREAVVPFDNYGDMVGTIRNTGRAADFFRAAGDAAGIGFGTSGSTAGGDGAGVSQLVGAGVGGGDVHNHYNSEVHIHVQGSVTTERELVDVISEGLQKNSRMGRGPTFGNSG